MKRELAGVAGTVAAIVALTVAGLILAERKIRLDWQNASGATVTGVERSLDLRTWTELARVTNATSFTFPNTNTHGALRVFHPTKARIEYRPAPLNPSNFSTTGPGQFITNSVLY